MLPLHRVLKNAAKLVLIFNMCKFMAKILSHRFVLRKNGKSINSYLTLGRALIGMESLYNRGDVLPYDSITIYDRQTLSYVY